MVMTFKRCSVTDKLKPLSDGIMPVNITWAVTLYMGNLYTLIYGRIDVTGFVSTSGLAVAWDNSENTQSGRLFRCVYGVLHRHSRDEKLLTPSGPEGSSGSSGFGCRDVAGVERHLKPLKSIVFDLTHL